jgi:Fe-S cluster assembly scaffold protein SufB
MTLKELIAITGIADHESAKQLHDFFMKAGIKDVGQRIVRVEKSKESVGDKKTSNITTLNQSETEALWNKYFSDTNKQSMEENYFLETGEQIGLGTICGLEVKSDVASIDISNITAENETCVVSVSKNSTLEITRSQENTGMKKNHVIILLQEDASVVYNSLHHGANSVQVTTETFFQKKNSKLISNIASLNQSASHHSVQSILLEENGDNETNVTFETKENQHGIVKVNNVFIGSNCKGVIKINGIIENHSICDIEGKIRIRDKANGTDSNLAEKLLLLGDNAICNAKPIIAIDTDDVKAGHGASMSRIDDEDLFYFQSRGIAKNEAHRLIKHGFLVAPFENLKPDHPFIAEINRLIDAEQ